MTSQTRREIYRSKYLVVREEILTEEQTKAWHEQNPGWAYCHHNPRYVTYDMTYSYEGGPYSKEVRATKDLGTPDGRFALEVAIERTARRAMAEATSEQEAKLALQDLLDAIRLGVFSPDGLLLNTGEETEADLSLYIMELAENLHQVVLSKEDEDVWEEDLNLKDSKNVKKVLDAISEHWDSED